MTLKFLTISGILSLVLGLSACGKKAPPEAIQPDHYPRTYPQP